MSLKARAMNAANAWTPSSHPSIIHHSLWRVGPQPVRGQYQAEQQVIRSAHMETNSDIISCANTLKLLFTLPPPTEVEEEEAGCCCTSTHRAVCPLYCCVRRQHRSSGRLSNFQHLFFHPFFQARVGNRAAATAGQCIVFMDQCHGSSDDHTLPVTANETLSKKIFMD